MRCRNKGPTCPTRGFTLLEVVIVVTVVGILLSLAVPTYRGYVIRAHRTGAIGKLLQVAACQERVYAATHAYDTGRCLVRAGEHYRLEYAEPGRAGAHAYSVVAVPLGPQSDDRCGALRMDHLGTRSVGNESADPLRCWSGR